MTDLRYPIGKPMLEGTITDGQRRAMIEEVGQLPAKLRAAVEGLNVEQLGAPYRPEGWTVQQVVHHLADSHMNAFVRFKLAITEQEPTIKPYNEKMWAETLDASKAAVEFSLNLIDGLHARWVILLKSLDPAAFSRVMVHPERGKISLDTTLRIYEWHGRHHTAHIASLRERMGWK